MDVVVPAPEVLGLVVGVLVLAATVAVLRQAVARGASNDGGAAVLVVLGLLWQQLNSPIEGAVLWGVTPSHGLVLADLVAAPAAAIVVGHVLMRVQGWRPARSAHLHLRHRTWPRAGQRHVALLAAGPLAGRRDASC